MDELIKITGALSDSNRIRIVMALRDGELCACQMIELLKLAPSTVSKHIFLLKNAGLVQSRKEGLWMYYSIPKRPAKMVRNALDLIFSSLKSDKVITKDKRRLATLRALTLENLCQKQRKQRGAN